MPRRDGTGPMGAGLRSGRGMGHACRRGSACGFGRGFASNEVSAETKKELLQAQRNTLENRIKLIDQQLEGL